MLETVILITVILLALSFDFINGFHDTANSIATTVSTRVLTPRAAILMAATLNFIGALTGHQSACYHFSTAGSHHLEPDYLVSRHSQQLFPCIDWWFGRLCHCIYGQN